MDLAAQARKETEIDMNSAADARKRIESYHFCWVRDVDVGKLLDPDTGTVFKMGRAEFIAFHAYLNKHELINLVYHQFFDHPLLVFSKSIPAEPATGHRVQTLLRQIIFEGSALPPTLGVQLWSRGTSLQLHRDKDNGKTEVIPVPLENGGVTFVQETISVEILAGRGIMYGLCSDADSCKFIPLELDEDLATKRAVKYLKGVGFSSTFCFHRGGTS